MKKYDGPSIYKRKKNNNKKENIFDEDSTFLPPAKENNNNLERAKKIDFTNEYELPDNLNSKNKATNGFKNYIDTESKKKNEVTSSFRPNFRAREIPSPMFGYTQQQKDRMKQPKIESKKNWNYTELKNTLKKEPTDFMLIEGYETPSLLRIWDMKKRAKLSTEKTKKKYGLHRSLSGIIEDDYNELKTKKRDVSGLFTDKST